MITASVAALSVSLALVSLPNCTLVNSGVQEPFGGATLNLATADGTVNASIPFSSAWFKSPTAGLTCVDDAVTTGQDSTGQFTSYTYGWGVGANAAAVDFETTIKVYLCGTRLGFVQRWPRGAHNVASGDVDGLVSAFPALELSNSGTPLGFAHFSGFMAGDYPQYGPWAQTVDSALLSGGIKNSGTMALYDAQVRASLVISPASAFMAASLAVRAKNTSNIIGTRVVEWGIMGNASEIPAGFEAEWIMVAVPTGPTEAVREWGSLLRQRYNRPDEAASHDRDLTLRTLGYSTDNGAYYYYWTGPNKSATYSDVMRELKAYSESAKVPYRYIQLDSWWYYRQDGADKAGVPLSGVTNWTALPNVFPDGGMPGTFAITDWPVMAHNRYWATNNVYASNPLIPTGPTKYTGKKFEFAWGTGAGLPLQAEFWDYLFTINANWGLTVYEQDWLSLTTNSMPQLTSNVTFGREWLRQMGRGAAEHGLTVQYCMSFPRHVFQALEIPAVTQARASNDYQPQTNIIDYDQWRIGDSSLFVTALGLAPSKDNFWSMPTPQMTPHYDPFLPSRETRNRLESLTSTLSNGVVQPSDRVGFTNRTLVIKACDASGRLLRPATAATPIDRYYARRSFGASAVPGGPAGVVHTTHSRATGGMPAHGYVFAAKLQEPFTLLTSDLPATLQQDFSAGRVEGWFAYEANTTGRLVYFPASGGSLTIPPNDEYSFEFWTFAPQPYGAAIVFIGEQGKWIAGSAQRFENVATSGTTMTVDFTGAPGEAVTVAFATNASPPVLIQATCTVGESLRGRVMADASTGTATCA